MKKILFSSLFLLFLCTGCTVEYKIDMTDSESILESVIVKESSTAMSSEDFDSLLRFHEGMASLTEYYINLDTVGNSKVGIVEKQYGNIINYSENTFLPEYYNSSIEISEKDNIMTITGDIALEVEYYSQFILPAYDTFTISFILDEEVVENNADKIDGNKYSWVLDGGKTNKEILLSYKIIDNIEENIDNISNEEETGEINLENSNLGLTLILVGLIAFIGIIAAILYFRINRD